MSDTPLAPTAPRLPENLWKKLTSTVGLVSVRHGSATNVMAAEWSYFVNKDPLYVAVVLGPRAATRGLLTEAGEFSLTLCAEDQAELADFAGSFSVADIDKSASELIGFGAPEATGTPWVTGGVLAVECVLRETVRFPVHTLYAGEVVAAHLPPGTPRPLVKHGAMHTLGAPVRRTAIVATAQWLPGGLLRVAATGPSGAPAGAPWRVSLLTPDGGSVPLGEYPPSRYGDFLAELPVPDRAAGDRRRGCRVRVERGDAKPGYATLGHEEPGQEEPGQEEPRYEEPGYEKQRHEDIARGTGNGAGTPG
ncbi:flavin reductase family protein [Streptomyces sp. NBC_01429]|uniref:flavin reductase family protein n=1 Tax=Streptomyces sp. NBC_01429 TaxID=2903862 RepID=UPI002E2A7FB3|nr:flavin reductase family protein [Streptomyces sp. NBC_01429]